jgi:hypothetical protein
MRRLIPNLIIAVLLAGSVVAYAELASTRGAPSAAPDSPAAEQRRADVPVTIRGQVRGLYPGAVRQLRLRFANRNRFAVAVSEIAVQAQASETGCQPESLSIGPPSPATKYLPPTSRRTAEAQITMNPDAPDACRAARLPLEFTARSERSSGKRRGG